MYRNWVIAASALYIGLSAWSLNKYPCVYGDTMIYAEPIWNRLHEGHMGTVFYPKEGGFDRSTLINGRIYAAIQIPFLKLFGWSVFALRFQSLLAGLLVLLLTYLIALNLTMSEPIALLSVGLLAFSHLFIFASHFARPDMTVTLFILSTVWLFQSKRWFLAGLVASLAIDVHPPGFIAIFVLGALWLQRKLASE